MQKLILLSCYFLILVACGQKTEKPTIAQENTSANTTTTTATYQWDKHQDFNIFFTDFKAAIKVQDKAAVLKMMTLPFKCNDARCNVEFHYEGSEKYQDLSIANEAEFNSKYDLIFTAKSIEIIQKEKPLSRKDFTEEDENIPLDEMYRPNEFCLDIDEYYVLSFMPNEKGMYKLNEIPYRP